MHRLLNKGNERGYTFLESIFQLLIMALFLQLFVLFFFWKEPIERQYTDYGSTEWELFAVDMQQLLAEVSAIEVSDAGEMLRFQNARGNISINQNGNVIRKRVNGNGHIPLLTSVRSTFFSIDGMGLTARVLMADGTRKERRFVIGLYPE
ncbi:competence type IV pilus minor pilin ComGF [Sporosarcina sp. FSL K6-1522]|uniref:competence type IV pilus minor pilin ComGF n=1 Tax=Sporosarcina sp. FSL K6-1522 TaxID=2921554 RepID=UPI003159D48E